MYFIIVTNFLLAIMTGLGFVASFHEDSKLAGLTAHSPTFLMLVRMLQLTFFLTALADNAFIINNM